MEALGCPSVNLLALARRVEAAHFPDSTATRDVVPNGMLPSALTVDVSIIDTTDSAANTTTAAGDGHEIRTEQPATGPKPYCE